MDPKLQQMMQMQALQGQQAQPAPQQLPWYLRAFAGEGGDKAQAAQNLMGFGSRMLASPHTQGFGQRFGGAMLGTQDNMQQLEQRALQNTMRKKEQERQAKLLELSVKDAADRRKIAEQQSARADRAEGRAERKDEREQDMYERTTRGYAQPEAIGDYGLFQRGPLGQLMQIGRPPAVDPMQQMMMMMMGGMGTGGMGGAPTPSNQWTPDMTNRVLEQLNNGQ